VSGTACHEVRTTLRNKKQKETIAHYLKISTAGRKKPLSSTVRAHAIRGRVQHDVP
jgi:hypothetical protein